MDEIIRAQDKNLAQGFIALKPWDVRTGKETSAEAIQKRAMKYF